MRSKNAFLGSANGKRGKMKGLSVARPGSPSHGHRGGISPLSSIARDAGPSFARILASPKTAESGRRPAHIPPLCADRNDDANRPPAARGNWARMDAADFMNVDNLGQIAALPDKNSADLPAEAERGDRRELTARVRLGDSDAILRCSKNSRCATKGMGYDTKAASN